MRKKLVRMTFAFVACFVLSGTFAGAVPGVESQGLAETPEWASVFPAETALAVAIEDVEGLRAALFGPGPSKGGLLPLENLTAIASEVEPKWRVPLETGTKLVKTVLEAFRGSLAIGVKRAGDSPNLLLTGKLKPEAQDFREYLSRRILPILEPLGIEPVFGKERGVDRMQVKDSVLYFATADSTLFASTDLESLLSMKKGGFSPESTVAGRAGFRKAISLVSPEGLFLFADLSRIPLLSSKGTRNALANLGLDRLESLALSADIEGHSLKLKLALANDGEFTKLPAILLRPNAATRAANFVPADYSVFVRRSMAGAKDAYREWQALVRAMVDDVSWKEYQDDLARVNEERGFGLEELLENLGDEVAVAVKFPELVGIPPTLALVAVKDEAKALEAVSGFLKRAGAEAQVSGTAHGATVYTTAVVPWFNLSYAAAGGYLFVGLAPSCVESALSAAKSGNCLAKERRFASAIEAAPEENLLFAYADVQRVTDFAASAVLWLRAKEAGDQAVAKGDLAHLVASFLQKQGLEPERLGGAVVCATKGKDYVSVRAEFPIGIVQLLASVPMEPLARARENARRAACLNNLRQLALSCHMYASDHKGRFPEKLSELHPYAPSLDVFCCPSSGTVISRPEEIDSRSSYKLLGGFVLKEVKELDKKLVLYESLENHGDGANVAFADNHCKWVKPEALRELLKEAGL